MNHTPRQRSARFGLVTHSALPETDGNFKAFLDRGGQFTLSDDSHGIDQIGFGYDQVLSFAQQVGISTLTMFEKGGATKDARFHRIATKEIGIQEVTTTNYFATSTLQRPELP